MLMIMATEMIILMALWMSMYMMSFKKKSSPKTMSPFECGYSSLSSKLPMSIQFTLLVFIFLLFDIELSILITSNWKITHMNKDWITMITTFMMFMMMSVMYEMMKKSFIWK